MMQKLFLLACSLIRELIIYLWNSGTTGYDWGGWVSDNGNGSSGYGTSQWASVLSYTTSGAAGRWCNVMVDLTNKSTITMYYNYSHGSNGNWNACMYINTVKTKSNNNASPANVAKVGLYTGTGRTAQLDVSAYSGLYYIQFYIGKGTYYDTGTVSGISISVE